MSGPQSDGQVAEPTSQPFKAALWMIGAIIAFSSLAVSGRALADELSTFEILFYRSLIGFVMVIAVGAAMGRLHEISTDHMGTHFVRNFCHFAGQNLWLYALAFIPLSQLFALEFTSPLWVTLFAPFLLGERLTAFRLMTLALGFVGVMIVARPGILEVNIGTLTAAMSAIAFAGSIVLTKRLTRTTSTLCILFWLTVIQSGFGLITTGWDFEIAWPSLAAWPWVVLVAVGGLSAHLCLTVALSLAPASIVVPMDFVRLPAIAVVGLLFYNEALDIFVFIGAAIIFAANYLNILRDTRH